VQGEGCRGGTASSYDCVCLVGNCEIQMDRSAVIAAPNASSLERATHSCEDLEGTLSKGPFASIVSVLPYPPDALPIEAIKYSSARLPSIEAPSKQ